MIVVYLLCSFACGWILSGLIALRDVRDLDELRAAKASQREAKVELLNRMAEK